MQELLAPICGNLFEKLQFQRSRRILPLTLPEPLKLGVLCMNCHRTILYDQVDSHSAVCITPIHTSEEAVVQFTLSKISKYISFLNSLIKSQKIEDVDRSVLESLHAYLAALTVPYIESDEIERLTYNIATMDASFIGSMNIRIYIERGHALAREVVKNLKPTSIAQNIEKTRSKIRSMKKTDKSINPDEQEMINLDMKRLEEINSEIISKNSASQFSQSFATESCEQSPRKVTQAAGKDPKKQFYSLCLLAKMNLSANDPAQTISINSLYEAAQEKNVPEEDWSLFIKYYLESGRTEHKYTRKSIRKIEISDI